MSETIEVGSRVQFKGTGAKDVVLGTVVDPLGPDYDHMDFTWGAAVEIIQNFLEVEGISTEDIFWVLPDAEFLIQNGMDPTLPFYAVREELEKVG